MQKPYSSPSLSDRSVLQIAGRAAYHGFVGGFLGAIPGFVVVVADLSASSHRSDVLFALWGIFTLAYIYVRVRRERTVKNQVPVPALWLTYVPAMVSFFVPGVLLGIALMMFLEVQDWSYAIGVAALTALVGAARWNHLLRDCTASINTNRQTIVEWIAAGGSEVERRRRLDYVRTKALLIGAVAAGVEEYDGAPRLTWPKPPTFRVQNYDHCEPVVLNPATGLPMAGESGIDVGGNPWGVKNDD